MHKEGGREGGVEKGREGRNPSSTKGHKVKPRPLCSPSLPAPYLEAHCGPGFLNILPEASIYPDLCACVQVCVHLGGGAKSHNCVGRNGLISKNPLARKIWVRLEKDLLGSLWGSGAGWKLDPEWLLQGLIPKAWGQRVVVCKAPLLYFMLNIGFGAPNSLVGECYNFPILQMGTRARRAKGQLHHTDGGREAGGQRWVS